MVMKVGEKNLHSQWQDKVGKLQLYDTNDNDDDGMFRGGALELYISLRCVIEVRCRCPDWNLDQGVIGQKVKEVDCWFGK
jgi:hypothetical protein